MVNLDTVNIVGKPSPVVYTILNKNFSLCEGKTFDIVLAGSEEGVVYTVVDAAGRIRASVTGSAGGGTLLRHPTSAYVLRQSYQNQTVRSADNTSNRTQNSYSVK